MKISPERQGLKIIRGDPKNPVRLNDETKSLNDFQVKDDDIFFKNYIKCFFSLILCKRSSCI